MGGQLEPTNALHGSPPSWPSYPPAVHLLVARLYVRLRDASDHELPAEGAVARHSHIELLLRLESEKKKTEIDTCCAIGFRFVEKSPMHALPSRVSILGKMLSERLLVELGSI